MIPICHAGKGKENNTQRTKGETLPYEEKDCIGVPLTGRLF